MIGKKHSHNPNKPRPEYETQNVFVEEIGRALGHLFRKIKFIMGGGEATQYIIISLPNMRWIYKYKMYLYAHDDRYLICD